MAEVTSSDIYDALNTLDKDYSSMSWNGFHLFGDKRSIDELKRLEHQSHRDAALVREILDLRDKLQCAILGERERCAKVAEDWITEYGTYSSTGEAIAVAIRALPAAPDAL
jgi:hypothetical protein